MSTNEKLRTSFGRLAQRLYSLEFDKNLDIQYDYLPEHSIKDILSGEILTSDLEDAHSLLLHYIGALNNVIQSVPSIINRYTFSSITDFGAGTHITEEEIKQQVQDSLVYELEYYKTELERLNEYVLAKNAELGDARFSNAGFKTLINLNVEEVGNLFYLMYESGLIPQIKEDGSKFEKKELAIFIQKNFSSNTTNKIGFDSIYNSLSRKSTKAESVVEDWLEKLLAIIKSTPEK